MILLNVERVMKVGVRRERDEAELVGVVANEKGSFGFQLRGRIVHFVQGGHHHYLLCTERDGFGQAAKLVTNLYFGQDDFFFFKYNLILQLVISR